MKIAPKDPKAIQAYQEAEGIARQVFAEDLLNVGLTTNDPAMSSMLRVNVVGLCLLDTLVFCCVISNSFFI